MQAEKVGYRQLPPIPEFTILRIQTGNRAARRHQQDTLVNPVVALTQDMEQATSRLRATSQIWQSSVAPEDSLGKVIFQGRPFINPWLEAMRNFSFSLDSWHTDSINTGYPSADTLALLVAHDFYAKKSGSCQRWKRNSAL